MWKNLENQVIVVTLHRRVQISHSFKVKTKFHKGRKTISSKYMERLLNESAFCRVELLCD